MTISSAFAGCSVPDLATAKDFYTRVLGLALHSETMGLTFALPGGGTFFVYPKPNHVPATYTVLNLVVQDIEAAARELSSRGVVFERYTEGPVTDELGIARGRAAGQGPDIAWFKDPAGNFLAVMQEG